MKSHSRILAIFSVTVLVLAPLVTILPLMFNPVTETTQLEVQSIVEETNEILDMFKDEGLDFEDAPQFTEDRAGDIKGKT